MHIHLDSSKIDSGVAYNLTKGTENTVNFSDKFIDYV